MNKTEFGFTSEEMIIMGEAISLLYEETALSIYAEYTYLSEEDISKISHKIAGCRELMIKFQSL